MLSEPPREQMRMKNAYAENFHSSGLFDYPIIQVAMKSCLCGKPDFWLHFHGCNTNTNWSAFLTDLAGRKGDI